MKKEKVVSVLFMLIGESISAIQIKICVLFGSMPELTKKHFG